MSINYIVLICTLLALLIQSGNALGPSVTQLTEPVDHGEGPVWDERRELVYFVDMFNGKLNSYNIRKNELHSITLDGNLTFAVPSKYGADRFVIGLNRKVVEIEWNNKNEVTDYKELTTVDRDKLYNRFNDAKADKQGRLWAGTMGRVNKEEIVDINAGSLYLITQENILNPQIVVSPVNISNGMAWNFANDKFYFIDTTSKQVKEYYYNDDTGEIFEPRIVFDVNNFSDIITGDPDGMTIDIDNNLWIALYGGGAVVKVDPRKQKLLEVIVIPAKYTTSVCWGGSNYDTLLVTTSRLLLDGEERKQQPAAGSLFAITNLKATGFKSYKTTVTFSEV